MNPNIGCGVSAGTRWCAAKIARCAGRLQSAEQVNEYGQTVADLRFSRLRWVRNQYVKGYCVLICHKHVSEPYELEERVRVIRAAL